MKAFRDPINEWLKETVGSAANPLISNLSTLTDEQYDFARAYVLCGSAKKAATRAGIPSSQNPNLLVYLPKIAACINILTARREEQLGKKTTAEILARLQATPNFSVDAFGVSEEGVQEREALIGKANQRTGNMEALSEADLHSTLNSVNKDNGIMQLPKVKMPTADHFGPEWLMERQVTIAERALQIEPVYDRKGRPIGTFTCNYAAASRALDSLAKMMGMFTQKIEITQDISTFKETELDARIRAIVDRHPGLGEIIDVTPGKLEKSKKQAKSA